MEKANTPLEQICFNTKDIKKLKEKIAPLYKSNVNLGASSNAVDVADTNLTTDIEKAFIIDFNGNIYKFIAFNENKDTAYIEYYANIKGEKGDNGETGETGARGYSIHYASVNFDNNIEMYLKNDISYNTPINVNDIVLFKNGYVAMIDNVDDTTITIATGMAIQIEIGSNTSGIYVVRNANQLTPVSSLGRFYYEGYLSQIENRENFDLKIGDKLIGDNSKLYTLFSIDITNGTFICIESLELITKEYTHNILLYIDRSIHFSLTIKNTQDTAMTIANVYDYLVEYEYNGIYQFKKGIGYNGNNVICGIYAELGSLFLVSNAFLDGSSFTPTNITDIVEE